MSREEEMFKDITALTHKYGLQEVRAVVEARYQSMMRDVCQFVSEMKPSPIRRPRMGERTTHMVDGAEYDRVRAEVARLRKALATTGEARECANFSPAGPLNCYVEPPEGWAVKLDPCPFCALALTDKEARNG